MACPGSVAKAAAYPNKPSIFAAEGTLYHEIIADCLEFGFDPEMFAKAKRTIDGFEVGADESMIGHAIEAVDFVREQIPNLHVETRVDLGDWLPGQFGTLDQGGWDDEYIYISDEKYGAGVAVSPVKNPQTMLYALGFWKKYARHHTKAKKIRIRINQPRCYDGGGEWEISLKNLLAFGEEAKAAAKATYCDDAELVAGEKQCQFCPAKNDCDALALFNLELMQLEFEDLDSKKEPKLKSKFTPERRSYIVAHAEMLTKWIKGLKNQALSDALSGAAPVPGFKAVHGREGNRTWTDEKKAEAALQKLAEEEEIFKEPKIISPTAAEKLVGKEAYTKRLKKFVARSDPKPILVPEEDARPALLTATDGFDVIDDFEE
jgi:hypothetical protein